MTEQKLQDVEVKVPIQRRNTFGIRMLKKLIRTQGFKHLAFNMGLRGFNRVTEQVLSFQRVYKGESLRKGEFIVRDQELFDSLGNVAGRFDAVYKPGVLDYIYNSRVDKGAALQASLMSGSSLGSISSPLPPLYIALSTSSLTPAHGDTTLTGETVVSGLARALGAAQNYVAPASLDAAASYDVFKQFTAGGAATIQSSGLFDASSSGNLFAEANLASSAVLATNDILQLTWTINI